MEDKYGRTIDYLRISLTDRCNLSCCYCKPETADKLQHQDILTYEELLEICRCMTAVGISKFKITGGEPLLRKDCMGFLRQLKKLPGAEQVTLTTNGIFLQQYLAQLKELGIDGINISLDTVDAAAYKKITGMDAAGIVQQAVVKAAAAGLPVKINSVPLGGSSEKELKELLQFAENTGVPLRFIELMPLSCNQRLQGLTGEEIRTILKKYGFILYPAAAKYGNGPAEYYRADNLKIPIGFIQPLHGKFCAYCNRIRLTSTGYLKTCLYSDWGINLKKLLRSGADAEKLREAILHAVSDKPLEHQFGDRPGVFQMNEIGG